MAAKPYIRFDNASGTTIEYYLEFWATFNPKTANGKPYFFEYSEDGLTLHLYEETQRVSPVTSDPPANAKR
jgi:hypothetical protein